MAQRKNHEFMQRTIFMVLAHPPRVKDKNLRLQQLLSPCFAAMWKSSEGTYLCYLCILCIYLSDLGVIRRSAM